MQQLSDGESVDVVAQVMEPFRWLMSAVLVAFHNGLAALGLSADGGWTWTLAIIGLVLVVRAALIPVFLAQVRAQRRMRLLQPDLKALQEKYTGRTDQQSRQAMAQEQMALYRKHGTNPFSACLPLLIQAPFFLGLFQVLAGIPDAVGRGTGIGAMEAAQAEQFNASTILGAPLSASLLHGGGDPAAVAVLALAMILVMTACQFLTQKLVTARTALGADVPAPLLRQQRFILVALPLVFAAGGAFFPIGVLVYWTVSNLWTLGQQYLVNRKA